MGWISWIVFGGLAGWVASIFMGTNKQQGCLFNVLIGIVGAFVGGFIVELITQTQFQFGWDWRSFALAVIGSISLLAITGRGSSKSKKRR
jgi:uncharacterized membrane protein YeaQ/YmgE (transglycosylase-associated protein family)